MPSRAAFVQATNKYNNIDPHRARLGLPNHGGLLFGENYNMDKHMDFGIRLEKSNLVEFSKEVMRMADQDSELLNTVYREISEKLGMDIAMEIYQLFKGQQINFPVRFFNPTRIQQIIVKEYDGTNIRTLAIKYNYSEKTIRRIIKDSLED